MLLISESFILQLQDYVDKEIYNQFQSSSASGAHPEQGREKTGGGSSAKSSKGFVVRGAPWSQPPAEFINDANDFPSLGNEGSKAAQVVPTPWGKPSSH